MATGPMEGVLRYIRYVTSTSSWAEQSDSKLLEQFVTRRDESAFAALLQRHSPLVLRICRHILGDAHAAEDAFQATFLVLARKAGGIRKTESLAAWLYRVAINIARTARCNMKQQRAREKQAAVVAQTDLIGEGPLRDWQSVVHEEVDKLPQKYRIPIVLCYLDGKSHDEAARMLGWPLGTVKGRLARARELLRARLTRRGLTLPTFALAAALTQDIATAQVPATMLGNTLKAALAFAVQEAIPRGTATIQAVSLAKETLAPLISTKLLTALALIVGTVFISAHAWNTSMPADQQEIRALIPDRSKPGANADPLPKGAVTRMGSSRFRHGGRVSSLAYLSQDKLLVSGGHLGMTWEELGRARVWDAETGKELHQFRFNGAAQVAASPDGKVLACADARNGTIILWDPVTKKEIRRFKGTHGFDGNVCGLAFSPDGKTLAHGGDALNVWHVDSGMLLYAEKDDDHTVLSVEFSADSKLLAFTRVDDTAVQLVSVDAWKKLAPFKSPRSVNSFALSDHKTLIAIRYATATQKAHSISVFDLATGQQLRQFEGHKNEVHGLTLSPDAKTLASHSTDKTIRLWDVATGKEKRSLSADQYAYGTLRFASDGKTLAWANSAGLIRIWDLATGKRLDRAEGHQGVVSSVVLSKDGKTLFSAGTDGTVRLWETLTGKELRRLDGHTGVISGISLTQDGKLVASVCPADRTVRVWGAADGKEVKRFVASPTYCEVAWLPDNKTLAVRRYDDQSLYLHDVVSGEMIRKITNTLTPNVFAYPDRNTEAANCGGLLLVSPDGAMLATAANWTHPSFKLWETAAGKRIPHPEVEVSDKAAVECAAFAPDSKSVFTATYRTIRHWEIGTGKQLGKFVAHEARIMRMAVSPDGKTLALVGNEPGIRLWDTATAKELTRLQGHQGPVTSLSWSGDSRILASGSSDGTILVWDVRSRMSAS
jgi:RNA polymerase sigma factor (sigma-70 family)